MPLGTAVAALMMPVVLESSGVPLALMQMAALCAVALTLAHSLRAAFDDGRDVESPWPTLESAARPLFFALSHPLLRPLALSTLVLSAVQVSFISYLVTFLHGELGWDLIAAGLALSAAQVGGVVGRILWGVVADRTQAERQTLLGLMATMALCGLVMPFVGVGTPHGAMAALAVIYGATAIGWNGVFLAGVARLVAREDVAMATGGSLFFTFLGVVVGPPLFGIVGGWSGSLRFFLCAFGAAADPGGLAKLARAC